LLRFLLFSLLKCSTHHRHLHSFPTRRSSDLSSFDASIMEVLMAFPAGAALVVPQAGLVAGKVLADTLTRYAVSHALIPPAVLAGMPTEQLAQLRTLIVGGDACPPDLVARWSE